MDMEDEAEEGTSFVLVPACVHGFVSYAASPSSEKVLITKKPNFKSATRFAKAVGVWLKANGIEPYYDVISGVLQDVF